MVLTRRWGWFLTGVGLWTWLIWPRFALAIWDDPRSWSAGEVARGAPTGFLWVHAVLVLASLAIGTAVGVLGLRGLRATRAAPAGADAGAGAGAGTGAVSGGGAPPPAAGR